MTLNLWLYDVFQYQSLDLDLFQALEFTMILRNLLTHLDLFVSIKDIVMLTFMDMVKMVKMVVKNDKMIPIHGNLHAVPLLFAFQTKNNHNKL